MPWEYETVCRNMFVSVGSQKCFCVVEVYVCGSLPVGNQLLVLCWSWCDDVPVKKGRRHLHWEGSCCFIFSSLLLIFFLHSHFFSLWALPGYIFSSLRGRCATLSVVHWLKLTFTSSVNTDNVCLSVSVFFSSQLTQILMSACKSVLWVHVSPMLHP